jgi:serine/threonine protein kinase
VGSDSDRPSSAPSTWLRTLASVPEEHPPLLPGAQLGRYTVEGLLGSGASGTVYAAQDATLRRRVALKIFRRAALGAPGEQERWLQEARIAASVSAPEIVAVYDIGEHDGRAFIAMELVEGPSLRDALRSGPLPIGRALTVAHDVASAMCCAHEARVVHRDIKPENLRLDREGRVKVLDFGLAVQEMVDGEGAPPSARQPLAGGSIGVGTRGYMAPEQLRNGFSDPRSDLFTLGVVLYEMLTGSLPFHARTPEAYLAAVDAGRYARASAGNAAVTPAVDAILARCLAPAPAARFASARELRAALARARPREGALARVARRSAWLAAVLLLPVAGVVAIRSRRSASADKGQDHAGLASTRATSLSDRPPLPSRVPEARAAYDDAVRLLRGGSLALASKGFARALELDPDLAAARIRISTYSMISDPLTIRQHLAKAHERQEELSPEDRAALDILESSVSVVTDTSAAAQGWAAAAERFPNDADTALQRAYALDLAGQEAKASAAYERAMSLDPPAVLALLLRGLGRAKRGDDQGAVSDLNECLARAPGAMTCLRKLAIVHEARGDCDAFAVDAERMTAGAPQDPQSYLFLSRALVATGGPVESVRLAREKAAELFGEPWTSVEQLKGETLVALWTGDLGTAERAARDLAARARGHVNEYDHELSTSVLLRVLEETGRPRDAADVAMEYRNLVPAWTGHEPVARGLVLRALQHSGRLSSAAYDALRDEWSRDLAHSQPGRAGHLAWITYFATPARDRTDAEQALYALPAYTPLPAMPATARPASLDAEIGRVYLLADRAVDAIPYLQQAARFCSRLEDPIQWTHAKVDLGAALQRTGDVAGACSEYGDVLKRWPESDTKRSALIAAREASDALRCSLP